MKVQVEFSVTEYRTIELEIENVDKDKEIVDLFNENYQQYYEESEYSGTKDIDYEILSIEEVV